MEIKLNLQKEILGELFEKSSPKPLQKLSIWGKMGGVCAIPVHQVLFYKSQEERTRARYLATEGCYP